MQSPKAIPEELQEIWQTQDRLMAMNKAWRQRCLQQAQKEKEILSKQPHKPAFHGERRYAAWKEID
jgi:hypothetical protein